MLYYGVALKLDVITIYNKVNIINKNKLNYSISGDI